MNKPTHPLQSDSDDTLHTNVGTVLSWIDYDGFISMGEDE